MASGQVLQPVVVGIPVVSGPRLEQPWDLTCASASLDSASKSQTSISEISICIMRLKHLGRGNGRRKNGLPEPSFLAVG